MYKLTAPGGSQQQHVALVQPQLVLAALQHLRARAARACVVQMEICTITLLLLVYIHWRNSTPRLVFLAERGNYTHTYIFTLNP